MTPLEIVAVALGVANIVLVIRRSLWNYPVGIAMVALYALIFWRVRLYSDAGLQLFFLVAQGYGWVVWHRAASVAGEVPVARLSARERLAWGAATLLLSLAWGWGMHRFTDAALPYWDALVAIPSVAAQVLMARRAIENWLVWILVDAVAMPLYAAKGLHATAVLYGLFLLLAAAGWFEWRRVERRQEPA